MKSLVDAIVPIQKVNIIRNLITPDDEYPNNALLPLLLYREVFLIGDENDTQIIRELLETNGWTGTWIGSIYDEHHFHSTAHEVLIALNGTSRVQFGGPNGITFDFEKGDVVIIPAGVSHCKVDETMGFACMGAYPDGQKYDMNFGKPQDRSAIADNIHRVPLPEGDPVYGIDGPLVKNWFSEKDQNTDLL